MSFITVWIYITAALLLCYALLILLYYRWFAKLKPYTIKPGAILSKNKFSIIIPARNEAAQISACIASIMANTYPTDLFEVIVVDDFSTDSTAAIVTRLKEKYNNLHIIRLAHWLSSPINSYKKKAIETGIEQSIHEWIITTDADCIVPSHWLENFDSYLQEHSVKLLAAPVMFTYNGSALQAFQCLDFLSLQGITAASVSAGFHSMCNGANLCYQKEAFLAVNGFKGVDDIASGDDMLLMYKIQQTFQNSCGYLFCSDAIVQTAPMPDWKSFINQRIRWASKANSYKDKRIFYVLLLVYFTNLFILSYIPIAVFDISSLIWFLIFVIIKTIVEWAFMNSVARFYKMQKIMPLFLLFQPLHITYTVIAGWLGRFGNYQWKGRTVK